MQKKMIGTVLAAALFATAAAANAAPILGSDFNTITTSGSTVSNITWAVSGITTPSGTMTFDVPIRGDNGDKIDVNQKVSGTGAAPWQTFIDIEVLPGTSIALTTLTLDWIAQNSSGSVQTQSRFNDWVVAINHRVGSTVGAELAPEIVQSDTWTTGLPGNLKAFSMDISSFGTLTAGSQYRLYLKTYVSDSVGHYVAFDNLAVSGDISAIPEPATLALIGLGGLMMIKRRKA